MSINSDKIKHLIRRKNRIRSVVSGTAERPRLSIFVSNRNISAQVINDEAGKTLFSATTVNMKGLEKKSASEKAAVIGHEIAKAAKSKKVTKVVLDRNGKIYHGRIKALANAAREAGLEI